MRMGMAVAGLEQLGEDMYIHPIRGMRTELHLLGSDQKEALLAGRKVCDATCFADDLA